MTASLTIVAGPDTGRSCDLLPGRAILVGRGHDCDLRLSDPGVSRIHCRVFVEAGGVRIEDADSRYGTMVNHQPVAGQHLYAGDTIEIGDTALRLESDPAIAETLMPVRLAVVASPDWLPNESVTYDAVQEHRAPTPSSDADAHDLIGNTLARFRVESLQRRTASGVIYRATDTVEHRTVALKVYWPALFANEVSMSRFLRSMRATIPLRHEHLVGLYSAGRSRGLCFTACEYVDGESAADRIDRVGIAGMLDWKSTWHIATGIAKALVYLHERSILHRGLHPSNILIRESDQCVKLGDSLLAKSFDELGQLALTARGDVVGDIFYLSPEQLRDGTTVDHRSDIYSLGATLYALLTGRPPFLGSPAELIRQIVSTPPEPPKQLQLAIPAAFEGIVLRMLAKRPEDRFANAEALLCELQRIGGYEGLEI